MKKKNFLVSISKEIEELGMKKIAIDCDGRTWYLQICDKDCLFDDKRYACHYEILYMGKDDIASGHVKNNIYVEIHFESRNYSKCFPPVLEKLCAANDKLELFEWREYCKGVRIKSSVFTEAQKEEILRNLLMLKEYTIQELTDTYIDFLATVNSNKITSSFVFKKTPRTIANKRFLQKLIREPRVISVKHELLRKRLIKTITEKPDLFDKDDPILPTEISHENKVNGIDSIDVVMKTQKSHYIFFEIKTCDDARLCIRQALGQLMEYANFPEKKNVHLLVVVGPGKDTENTKNYINLLNKEFGINIRYLPV